MRKRREDEDNWSLIVDELNTLGDRLKDSSGESLNWRPFVMPEEVDEFNEEEEGESSDEEEEGQDEEDEENKEKQEQEDGDQADQAMNGEALSLSAVAEETILMSDSSDESEGDDDDSEEENGSDKEEEEEEEKKNTLNLSTSAIIHVIHAPMRMSARSQLKQQLKRKVTEQFRENYCRQTKINEHELQLRMEISEKCRYVNQFILNIVGSAGTFACFLCNTLVSIENTNWG